MAISFGGINTGLPPNLVDQLIDAERIPIKNVESRKTKTEAKLKLVTELDTKLRGVTGSLKELASSKGFSDIKLNSGDPNIVQGAVDPGGASKGSWNVEVVRLANKAAAISNGFPDKDKTEIGVGYFKFKTPEGSKEVYINGNNNTLEGAVKAINAAGVGMRATAINDRKDPDKPWRLMVSGTGNGVDNMVQYPTLYFLDGDQDFYFDEERPAQNGLVKLDGFEFEINDNTVTDAIPGVTLDIKQAAPGRIVNISVKEDSGVVTGKIKKFVDSMNEVFGFIQGQLKVTEKTDTTQTLGGDGTLRQIESDLRRLVQNQVFGVAGDVNRLSQLGISFNRGGLLEYSEDQFTSALSKKTAAVQSFLVGDGFNTGFIPSVRRVISNVVDGAFGPLSNRKKGLTEQIKQADSRIEQMERRLTAREKTLREQFSKLEEKMSQLKSQGAMLSEKLGGGASIGMNMSGMSNSKN